MHFPKGCSLGGITSYPGGLYWTNWKGNQVHSEQELTYRLAYWDTIAWIALFLWIAWGPDSAVFHAQHKKAQRLPHFSVDPKNSQTQEDRKKMTDSLQIIPEYGSST